LSFLSTNNNNCNKLMIPVSLLWVTFTLLSCPLIVITYGTSSDMIITREHVSSEEDVSHIDVMLLDYW
jgi:hypothetical protein